MGWWGSSGGGGGNASIQATARFYGDIYGSSPYPTVGSSGKKVGLDTEIPFISSSNLGSGITVNQAAEYGLIFELEPGIYSVISGLQLNGRNDSEIYGYFETYPYDEDDYTWFELFAHPTSYAAAGNSYCALNGVIATPPGSTKNIRGYIIAYCYDSTPRAINYVYVNITKIG